jgi:acyl carrier protein
MTVSERYRVIAGLRQARDILRAATVATPRAARDVRSALVPASTACEGRLAEIWRDVLGLDEVGIDDNFFSLGGDSLHLTQVLARVESRLGRELPADAFFEGPTIREIAARLAQEPHA